jgi:NADH dehydrogenase [ubiquinone] 1 alpha subcomplex assembly factor 5
LRRKIVSAPRLLVEHGPFDRSLVAKHRDRAAIHFAGADFLKRTMAKHISERVRDVPRSFDWVLDLGCHTGFPEALFGTHWVSCDLSSAMVEQAPAMRVCASEEALPFAPASFDLILSAGSLHWVNDLPGSLIQIRHCLKPDGLFVACLLGGETLSALRACFLQAEAELTLGASPRISPMLDVREGGALLQRAGFAMPVADIDTLEVHYQSPWKLLADLRAMGETNALHARARTPLRREVLAHTLALYNDQQRTPEGLIRARFDLVTLTAWAPAQGQPTPRPRGSASISLAQVLPKKF